MYLEKRFGRLKMLTFENRFQSFWKQYLYRLRVNYNISENSDIMRMHIMCSVCRHMNMCVVFLYKVTSPTTGLACIIQHF